MISAGRPATRLLWLGLWLLVLITGAAARLLAQAPPGGGLPGAPPPPQAESGGDPMFGYFVYGLFAGLIIFLVCKSARRARSAG
jgi:hypothetical protein